MLSILCFVYFLSVCTEVRCIIMVQQCFSSEIAEQYPSSYFQNGGYVSSSRQKLKVQFPPQELFSLECIWLNQVEGRQPPCEIRYRTKITYKAIPVKTTKANTSPLTSENTKSSKRYPLITITSTATVHAIIYNRIKGKQEKK